MSQTSYSIAQSAAKNGQLADIGIKDVISKINLALALKFGTLGVRGASEGLCTSPAAAGDVTDEKKVLGVVLCTQDLESSLTGDPQYPIQSAVPLLRKGRVWVKTEETATVASDVFVRYAAGGNGVGSFGVSAGTSERAALANAKVTVGAAANGLMQIEVNF